MEELSKTNKRFFKVLDIVVFYFVVPFNLITLVLSAGAYVYTGQGAIDVLVISLAFMTSAVFAYVIKTLNKIDKATNTENSSDKKGFVKYGSK